MCVCTYILIINLAAGFREFIWRCVYPAQIDVYKSKLDFPHHLYPETCALITYLILTANINMLTRIPYIPSEIPPRPFDLLPPCLPGGGCLWELMRPTKQLYEKTQRSYLVWCCCTDVGRNPIHAAVMNKDMFLSLYSSHNSTLTALDGWNYNESSENPFGIYTEVKLKANT